MVTFGVQVEPQFGFSYDEIRRMAASCGELGFSAITISDHFMLRKDSAGIPCLECWTLLSALAVDVPEVRMGPLVTCASYRPPGLLAKMASTVDVLSGGRLEFGIGAGWKRLEYEAYGYPFPPLQERAEQLGEAIQILKLMWTEDRASFQGRYYRIRDALCNPKPLQRPLAISVGGKSDAVLDVAARLADGVNIPFVSPEGFQERVGYLESRCEALGRGPSEVRKSTFLWAFVGSGERVDRMVRDFSRTLGMPEEDVRRAGQAGFMGPPSDLVDLLSRYVETGADQIILGFPRGWEVTSMEVLHQEVLPSF